MQKLIARKTELIGKSDTNPEFYKFRVHLSNGDVIPVYAKDAQSALRKVNWRYNEKVYKERILVLSIIVAISLASLFLI